MEDDYQIAMDAIKDQADGEYEAYHAAASEQQQWDQLQNELATLRAELAEARQHAEYQDKEIRQWASVCYVGTWPLSDEDTKNTGFYGRLAAKMTAERNTATARAEKAEAENAALKAHAERLRGDIESAVERMDRDSDEEESVDTCLNCGDGARDRIDSEQWKFDDHGDMLCRECGSHRGLCGYKVGGLDDVKETLKAALAGTPAQSLAKLRSDALIMAAEHCEESEVLMPCPAPGVTLKEYGASVCLALGQELRIKAAALQEEAENGTT